MIHEVLPPLSELILQITIKKKMSYEHVLFSTYDEPKIFPLFGHIHKKCNIKIKGLLFTAIYNI